MAYTKQVDGTETIFRKAGKIEESAYPGLNERRYVLKKGSVQREGGMPLMADVLVEQDVPVQLRDGVTIRCDIYRPVEEGKYPAIMGWSPYGKRGSWLSNDVFGHPTRMDVPVEWEDGLNKFEAPNPAYWIAHGYVILAPDPRGVFFSEGDIHVWGTQEPDDEYDVIEWAARQDWSNGKIGLTGNSMLAMSQWFVAAQKPPHLAAIAPWEGAADIYRDTFANGGIPEPFFTEGIFSHLYGKGLLEDPVAMIKKYPLMNDYWEAKVPALSDITVPAYIVASWTNLLHTGGTLRGWENISSEQKWLRVNDTHEWTDYYDPKHVDDLRRFFDRFLKGIDNGWEQTPKVRLSVLDPGHHNTVDRAESDFPLSRQETRSFYLGKEGDMQVLRTTPQENEEKAEYQGDGGKGVGTTFTIRFDEVTELTGHFSLKLWVEAKGSDDLDIFAFVRKRDAAGNIQECSVVTERTHPGPNGRLRVSMRATDPEKSSPLQPFMLFDREEKLAPGEIVPIEIGFWPYGMRWQAGETLELFITGTDILVRPEFPELPPIPTLNKGTHVIHFGGKYDSQLRVPLITGA